MGFDGLVVCTKCEFLHSPQMSRTPKSRLAVCNKDSTNKAEDKDFTERGMGQEISNVVPNN